MINIDDYLNLHYKEMLSKVLEFAPKNRTWYEVSDWVEENISQDDITKIYGILYKALINLDLESEEADYIRDEADIFWRVGNHDNMNAEINKIYDEHESKKG